MKKIIIIIALILSSVTLSAQYSLHSSVFGAGAESTGGAYILRGSVSQPNVGITEGGNYSMKVGFWSTYSYKAYPPAFSPTTQATGIKFSNITRTSMTVSWSRGNGEKCILLGRAKYAIPSNPLTDGVSYNANSDYSLAPTVSSSKVLFNDNGNSVSVSGLTKYNLMYYKVIEYNEPAPGNTLYLQADASGNPASRWTLRRDGLMAEDLSIDAEYAYPNPAINSISTTLDVFEEGRITATMYDIEGRTVATLYDKHHNFGTYELNFDISTIPSGVYHLVISKGSEAIVYPVSVVR